MLRFFGETHFADGLAIGVERVAHVRHALRASAFARRRLLLLLACIELLALPRSRSLPLALLAISPRRASCAPPLVEGDE